MSPDPVVELDAPSPPLSAGGLTLLPDDFVASYDGQELDLTYRQFRLLQLFAAHPGRLLRRDVIARHAWDGEAPGRSVDIQISRLRKKLPPGVIQTVVRLGYRFTP